MRKAVSIIASEHRQGLGRRSRRNGGDDRLELDRGQDQRHRAASSAPARATTRSSASRSSRTTSLQRASTTSRTGATERCWGVVRGLLGATGLSPEGSDGRPRRCRVGQRRRDAPGTRGRPAVRLLGPQGGRDRPLAPRGLRDRHRDRLQAHRRARVAPLTPLRCARAGQLAGSRATRNRSCNAGASRESIAHEPRGTGRAAIERARRATPLGPGAAPGGAALLRPADGRLVRDRRAQRASARRVSPPERLPARAGGGVTSSRGLAPTSTRRPRRREPRTRPRRDLRSRETERRCPSETRS